MSDFVIEDDENTTEKTIVPSVSKSAEVSLYEAGRTFTDEQLSQITTVDAAFALLDAVGVVNADEVIGSGFIKTENKSQFLDKSLVFIQCTFHEGDYTEGFVAATLITEDGGRFIIIDGSTGINAQLRAFSANNSMPDGSPRMCGMICKNGLRVSPFKVCDAKGCGETNNKRATKCRKCDSTKLSPAETFYINA